MFCRIQKGMYVNISNADCIKTFKNDLFAMFNCEKVFLYSCESEEKANRKLEEIMMAYGAGKMVYRPD